MSVQFEWQVGSDDDQWETIAQTGDRRRRKRLQRMPWLARAWKALLAGIILSAGVGYVVLRIRYDRMCRLAEFQIQNVIDLEARAFADQDRDLFLAQQDRASSDWHARQSARMDAHYPLVLPAEVQSVELRGNLAWVEVAEGQDTVRRVRFYRQTDRGWKHTAPHPAFWKDSVSARYNNVVVRYHQRDRPYIDPLLERISRVSEEACAALLFCSTVGKLEVAFSVEARASDLPHLERRSARRANDRLVLPSPWLSGIPVDGTWDKSTLDELTYWVAYAVASGAAHSSSNAGSPQLQRAIADEYAAWYAYQDRAQAPILGRILERHGADELPRVFLSLRGSRIVSLFLTRWLSLHPTHEKVDFFETFLNIEREAILAGRKDTFLLLQHPDVLQQRAAFYDRARSYETALSLSPVRVRAVEVIDDRALVTLEGSPNPLPGIVTAATTVEHRTGGPLSMETGRVRWRASYTFFRQGDWDWKHAGSDEAAFWNIPLSTTYALAPSPTPIPDQSR